MQAVDHTTWLIVQDRIDELVFHVELAPLADLAQVLAATIEQLEEHGWRIEGTPSFGGFFCNRDGERWFVHIVHYDPTWRPPPLPSSDTIQAISNWVAGRRRTL